MLARLVCQDLLAAGAALTEIGVDGDGIIWLGECGALPRHSVTDMIARGPDTGLPVLAATTSPQVGVELAELTNVVVAHRMNDAAAARHLARAVGVAAPELLPVGSADAASPAAASPAAGLAADPGSLPALREGEFLLTVKNPRRLVPRGSWYGHGSPPFTPESRPPPHRSERRSVGRECDVLPRRRPVPGLAVRDALSGARTAAAQAYPARTRTAQP